MVSPGSACRASVFRCGSQPTPPHTPHPPPPPPASGLLITLAILKSLIQECPRDLAYISASAQTILVHALSGAARASSSGARDIDLSARASSTFFAYTSALEPSRNSVDGEAGRTYLNLLASFGQMAVETSSDAEDQNRTRLIALGALSGAVSSGVMYTSTFQQQANLIIPPLLANIEPNAAPLDNLEQEAQKTTAGTPSFAEFSLAARKRPGHRRAPSLSRHVAGEKGPEASQVISAAMGILQGLFRHADATQILDTIKPITQWMDGAKTGVSQWTHEDWACLLAKTLSRWTALQYRFVVLTGLVEHLVEICDGPSEAKHATLLAMIADILKSKDLTLIGLSTSDTLNNLAGLAVRRVHFDTKDPLLPQIVECIESLSTHIYYADQLSDIAEELVARIVTLSQPDPDTAEVAKTSHLGRGQPNAKTGEEQKLESIRILLFALMRVIVVANSSEGGGDQVHAAAEETTEQQREKGKETGPSLGITVAGTRSRIQPDVLQPTTALLASYNPSVRLAEAQLLLEYFKLEALEPAPSSTEAASLGHAISAATHVSAISKSLRIPTPEATENPLGTLVFIERAREKVRHQREGPDAAAASGSEPDASVPVDYAALIEVLTALTDKLSAAALLAAVPGLLAIDRSAAQRLVPDADAKSSAFVAQKRRASRVLLARVWTAIGQKWDVAEVQREAENALASLADNLPPMPATPAGLTLPIESELFPDSHIAGEGSGAAKESFNSAAITQALAQSPRVQEATGLGAEALLKWFSRDWNVTIAVDDSAIGASPYHDHLHGAGSGVASAVNVNGDHAGAAASSLQRVPAPEPDAEAVSYRSPSTVGVDDFRQALGSARGTYGTASLKKGSHLPIPGLANNGSASGNGNGAAVSTSTTAGGSTSTLATGGAGAGGSTVNVNGTGAGAYPPSPMSASERRASRRASRGQGQQQGKPPALPPLEGVTPSQNGHAETNGTGTGIGGLLDSLGISSSTSGSGSAEKEGAAAGGRPLVPPHAA